MIDILMISGPALGHVARLSLIAEALISRPDVNVHFVVPGFSNHISITRHLDCVIHTIDIQDKNRKFPAPDFAKGVEALFEELKPDAIVQDCSPLRWMSAVRFPDCPRAVVTNAFLTENAGLPTYQTKEFEQRREKTQRVRDERDLPDLHTAYDLYKGTKILLADPEPLANQFSPWPDKYEICGPLCIEDDTALPKELAEASKISLFSMGSTGGLEAFSKLADRLKSSGDSGPSVYVGSKASLAKQSGCFDYVYDWLPLASILKKTAICITHGGTGSTYLALSKGVPVLMSPTHANHRILADCIRSLGVGDFVDSNGAVDNITVMSEKLSKMTKSFDHRSAPKRHADAILDMLSC